jgi:hypothetical protein
MPYDNLRIGMSDVNMDLRRFIYCEKCIEEIDVANGKKIKRKRNIRMPNEE